MKKKEVGSGKGFLLDQEGNSRLEEVGDRGRWLTTSLEYEEKASTRGWCSDHPNRVRSDAKMDRTGVTVATVKTVATLRGVSILLSIFFLSDPWTMMKTTRAAE